MQDHTVIAILPLWEIWMVLVYCADSDDTCSFNQKRKRKYAVVLMVHCGSKYRKLKEKDAAELL